MILLKIKKILSFLTWLIKNPLFLMGIVVIGLIGYAIHQHNQINKLEELNREKEQNIGALQNTITHYVTELEREVSERIAFAGESGAEIAGLEETIADLEKEKRTVISLQDISAFISIEDKPMDTEVTSENDTTRINSKFDDEWATIETTTILTDKTTEATINRVNIPVNLLTGVTQRDDGMLVTFVSVDNPYVEYKHKGFVFDPENYVDNGLKKHHILIAVLTGMGIGLIVD